MSTVTPTQQASRAATRTPIELETAQQRILAHAAALSPEVVAVDNALDRVLSQDVHARQAVPGFNSSAMDGYAVRSQDTQTATEQAPARLLIVGESRAGVPSRAAIGSDEAVSISTGALLPAGADAIVRLEATTRENGHIEVLAGVDAGRDVRRAGEDLQPGQSALTHSTKLGPAEIGVLASLGITSIVSVGRPWVSLLVTGDELRDANSELGAGTIRDSNSHSLAAFTRRCGAQIASVTSVGDDPDATVAAIAAAADVSDVTVICGGISVGEHDHVRASLAALNAKEAFWGVALKPGHPAWFGTLGETLVFGLPGNPVAAMVTFALLVRPALRALAGQQPTRCTLTATIDTDYEKRRPGNTHALPCKLRLDADGWHVAPTRQRGSSHVLTSMLGADALALIPGDVDQVKAGDSVVVEPLTSVLGS